MESAVANLAQAFSKRPPTHILVFAYADSLPGEGSHFWPGLQPKRHAPNRALRKRPALSNADYRYYHHYSLCLSDGARAPCILNVVLSPALVFTLMDAVAHDSRTPVPTSSGHYSSRNRPVTCLTTVTGFPALRLASGSGGWDHHATTTEFYYA